MTLTMALAMAEPETWYPEDLSFKLRMRAMTEESARMSKKDKAEDIKPSAMIESRHCHAAHKHTPHAWTKRGSFSVWWCEGQLLAAPLPSDDTTPDEDTPIDWDNTAIHVDYVGSSVYGCRLCGWVGFDNQTHDCQKGENVDSTPEDTPRASVLKEAIDLITGDRNNSYGPPTQDFKRTADALTAFGFRVVDALGTAYPIKRHHVALIVDTIKTSRIMWSPTKRDNWTDKGGYAGCGYECALADAEDEGQEG